MSNHPRQWDLYQNKKTKQHYSVMGIGKHSETLEDMVIYRSHKDFDYWVRPLELFKEKFDLIEDYLLDAGK